MKIDFNKPFVDLDGNEVIENESPAMIGKSFARVFSQDKHTNTGFEPLDAFDIALKANRGECFDLTKKEQESMVKWIKENEFMTVSLKAQLLGCLKSGDE